jgi:hypothetical protein
LNLAHCFAALQTAVTLDNAVAVLETTKLLGFTIAAMTRHLILSGVGFTVTLNRLDSVP